MDQIGGRCAAAEPFTGCGYSLAHLFYERARGSLRGGLRLADCAGDLNARIGVSKIERSAPEMMGKWRGNSGV